MFKSSFCCSRDSDFFLTSRTVVCIIRLRGRKSYTLSTSNYLTDWFTLLARFSSIDLNDWTGWGDGRGECRRMVGKHLLNKIEV